MFKNFLIALFCFCSVSLFAGSVRLYNDSPFKLRAVIRGADGTFLGEMVLLPEHFNTWSSNYPSFGPSGKWSQPNPNRTLTPYTVYWYCLDGGNFGIQTNVAAGQAVIAESSVGPRMCKPPKKKRNSESPYGPKEDDETLHESDEPSKGEHPILQEQ